MVLDATVLGAPGIATRSKKLLGLLALLLGTRMLLGAPGLTTGSKDVDEDVGIGGDSVEMYITVRG